MPNRREYGLVEPPPSGSTPRCGGAVLPARRTAVAADVAMMPGLQVVSRQYPAADAHGPRTRWLDAVPLSAERTAFSIGSVAGTGPAASDLARRLRQESRAGAVLGLPPARVLTRLRGMLSSHDETLNGTSLYLVHDGATESLALANAGHNPAVAVGPDGATSLVGAPVGSVLTRTARYRTTTMPFSPGASLVLVAHPPHCHAGRPADEALMAEIAESRLFARGSVSLARMCEALALRLGRACTEHMTTVMVAQSTGGTVSDRPSRRFPGEPASAAAARAFTLQTMDEWKLGEKANRAAVIIGELAANAIQHAGSPFEVRLARVASAITLEVADSGPQLPRLGSSGAYESCGGLLIVETLADRWGTRLTDGGKTVWAELQINAN